MRKLRPWVETFSQIFGGKEIRWEASWRHYGSKKNWLFLFFPNLRDLNREGSSYKRNVESEKRERGHNCQCKVPQRPARRRNGAKEKGPALAKRQRLCCDLSWRWMTRVRMKACLYAWCWEDGKLPSFDLYFSLKIGKQNHQLRINRQEKLKVKESRKWRKNSEEGRFRKKQTDKE